MACVRQPLTHYLAQVRRELRAEYPEIDRDEMTATLRTYADLWFREIVKFDRAETVPAPIYRSYAYHVGRADAIRAFRHVANAEHLAMSYPIWLGNGEFVPSR